jgi:hypothetical protein
MGMSFVQGPETPGLYAYLQSKAKRYLEVGPDAYREGDFFDMPPSEWDQDTLDLVAAGMEQLVAGHGAEKEDPLTGLGIHGFYAMMAVMHFKLKSQALIAGGGRNHNLDRMCMRHRVDGRSVGLYNLVTAQRFDED